MNNIETRGGGGHCHISPFVWGVENGTEKVVTQKQKNTKNAGYYKRKVMKEMN